MNIAEIVTKYINAREGGKSLELEMRIGSYDPVFISNIGLASYNRVKEYILKLPHQEVESIDTVDGDIRQTKIGDMYSYMSKQRLAYHDIMNLGIRFALSSETQLRDITNFSTGTNTIVRNKNRFSTKIGSIRVDLTKVTTSNSTSYELEAELIDDNTAVTLGAESIIRQFNSVYELLMGLVHDSYQVFTSSQAGDVIEYVNRSLLDLNDATTKKHVSESEVRNAISHYPFPRPRNLKLEDLKYGGIVGALDGTTYSVTYKADGIHKVLVVDNSGLWLINPPNAISLIVPINDALRDFIGLMLEGELVPKEKRRQIHEPIYLFYVFDCIAIPSEVYGKSDRGVQNAPLNDRCLDAQDMVDAMLDAGAYDPDVITIKVKSHYSLTVGSEQSKDENPLFGNPNGGTNEQSVKQFFDRMTWMLTNEAAQEFETDGLIITPNIGPYNTHASSKPSDERILSKIAEVVKYKPLDKMTIDFTIKDVGNAYELYTYSSYGKKLEIFNRFPKIEKLDLVFLGDELALESGMIVEIGFNSTDEGELKPIVHRVRSDKIHPNGSDVALSTFKDILNPITPDMLMGRNLRLMRHYHGQVKRMMFDYAIDKSGRPINTLLDLGSGRGGDIGKWRGFDKIVAVEPNPEYIEEMKKRLTTYGMLDKVTIIQAGAQDTDIIRREMDRNGISKVSCISAMLSMTFLWETRETLQGLANTINEFLEVGGLFIYMVMDGSKVKQLFKPGFVTQQVGTTLVGHDVNLSVVDFDGATIRWLGNRMVNVHVNDSIVTEQDEYLVYLDDLANRLGELGFEEMDRTCCDKERFLSIPERAFSSLFTYGSFIKNMKPRLPENRIDILTPSAFHIPILDTVSDLAVNDGRLWQVEADWFKSSEELLATMGTIGDASNFFHALLRIIDPEYDYTEYGEARSLTSKLEKANNLRQIFAQTLNQVNPQTGQKYYFETELFKRSQAGSSYYGIENITKVLNKSSDYIGEVLLDIVPLVMGNQCDLVILKLVDGKLIHYKDTIDVTGRNTRNYVICLVANDLYFEPLIVYDVTTENTILQFEINSILISSYLKRKISHAARH